MDMKHILSKGLLAAALLACTAQSDACTNLIVGKAASADGSVMVTYSADNYGMYGDMYRHIGGRHAKGEMRKIVEWDSGRLLGEIPQAEVTYNVTGQMNANQVTITETTFGGRGELADSTGLIDYGSLMYIGLERSKTAREAIKIITTLAEKYGYCSYGESFTVADKNEAWILEMVGGGAGSKKVAWAAVRIPDDCISAHANQSRITRIDMKDKKNVMYSANVIKMAREKGFFSGKDSDFSFRDAYCPIDFGGIRFCDARVWSFFNMYVKGMDKYLDYINGKDLKGEMPLYVKPDRKLTVRDIHNAMRDHYECTPLDCTADISAGSYASPYRPSPLSYKVDGKEYFNERPISTAQAGFVFVGQMRSTLPDAIGGIVWWANDDANTAAFTPVYCGVSDIPHCYSRIVGEQDEVTFTWESAYWTCNTVANTVYPYYSKMIGDVRKAQAKLEDSYAAKQADLEKEAAALYATDPAAAIKKLTDYSNGCASTMMSDWKKLFEFLIVKHTDMCIKSEKDGKFSVTPEGMVDGLQRPGMSEQFRKTIATDTGDRYLMR